MAAKVERSVGERVKKVRFNLGLSKSQLAKSSGLTPAAISKIEKGDSDIVLSTAKNLAKSLGVSIDYLAGVLIYPDTEMSLRIELAKFKQRMYEIEKLVIKEE